LYGSFPGALANGDEALGIVVINMYVCPIVTLTMLIEFTLGCTAKPMDTPCLFFAPSDKIQSDLLHSAALAWRRKPTPTCLGRGI